MKVQMCAISVVLSFLAGAAGTPFKNGTSFSLREAPSELTVQRRAGEPVRFQLEENATTGYRWEAEWNPSECDVMLDHRGARTGLCGAAGALDVVMTSRI